VGVRLVIEVVAAGLVSGELLAARPEGAAVAAALAAALAGAGLRVRAARMLAASGALAIGAGWGAGTLVRAVPSDPADVARLPLPVRGRLEAFIAEPPVVSPGRTVVVLDAQALDRGGGPERARGRIRLSIRGERRDLARGMSVSLATTLRRPHDFENPGHFDFVGLLARRGVHVVAGAWDAAAVVRLADPPPGLTARIDRWRAVVREAILRATPPETGAVLAALVVGDESGVGDRLRRAFTRAGVVHVLSVSGLHVSIVAGAAALAIGWLVRRSEWLLLHGDGRTIALVASLVPTLVYGALAGFQVATLRSVAMAAAGVVAVSLRRRATALRALALAATAVALGWPGAPAEISFQLSFASVLALACCGTRAPRAGETTAERCRRVGRDALVLSAAAWSATAPLTALYFHQASLASVVANPVIVPLFGVVVLLPALAGAFVAPMLPAAADWCFAVAGRVVAVGVAAVRWVGERPWAAVDTPIPTLVELALAYAVIVGIWGGRRPWARALLAAALGVFAVDVAWWAHARWTPGVLRATFLDVGQGDAAVVELPDGRVLVVDAGGFAGSEFDTGTAIVEPFLRSRKIATLDAVVMTHAHPDHMGGLAALVRSFRPRAFWWSGVAGQGATWRRLEAALDETGTPAQLLARGSAAPEFLDVDVLSPPLEWTPPSQNDASLVLRVRRGRTALLLTGDVERAAEARLLEHPAGLRADVVKVAHHGSATSSAWPFVVAAAPAVAVVSVGAENRYGHPDAGVERAWRGAGARVLRTDRCGAIEVVLDGATTRVATTRPGCADATTPARP
jgi:competence protein ComEC